MGRKFTIYHIKFKDGAEYIGQTMKTLEERIKDHENRPANTGVARRLKAKMPFTVSVVSKHLKQVNADAAELNSIWKRARAGKRVLNRRGVDLPPAGDASSKRSQFGYKKKRTVGSGSSYKGYKSKIRRRPSYRR